MDRAAFEPAHSEMGSTAELPILMAVSPTCHTTTVGRCRVKECRPSPSLRTRLSESPDSRGRFLRLLLEGFFSCLYSLRIGWDLNPRPRLSRSYGSEVVVSCSATELPIRVPVSPDCHA